MMVDYLSPQFDWAGYQMSTKQRSGPISEDEQGLPLQ